MDFDIMDGVGALDQAQAQSRGQKLVWGKFSAKRRVTRKGDKWNDDRTVKEVSKAQYEKAIADGAKESDFSFAHVYTLDTEELGSQYPWERSYAEKGPDMQRTIIPSVKALLGDPDATTKDALAWIRAQEGVYLEIEEVPQVDFDGKPVGPMLKGVPTPVEDGGKVYYAARFSRVLSGKDEAQALHSARWGQGAKSSNGTAATIQRPSQYSVKVWETTIIPAIKADIANGVSVAEIAAGHEIDAQYVQQFVTA